MSSCSDQIKMDRRLKPAGIILDPSWLGRRTSDPKEVQQVVAPEAAAGAAQVDESPSADPLPDDLTTPSTESSDSAITSSDQATPETSTDDEADTPTLAPADANIAAATPSAEDDVGDTDTTVAAPLSAIPEGPDTTTTISYITEQSTLGEQYKSKRWTKEESADLFMYGPNEDWEVLPKAVDHPQYPRQLVRKNRALAVREAYIAKVNEERADYEKAENIARFNTCELPSHRARKRELALKRVRKRMSRTGRGSLWDRTATTSNPLEAMATHVTVAGTKHVSDASQVQDVQPADSKSTDEESGTTGSEVEESSERDESLEDDEQRRQGISQAIYRQPIISVRDNKSSKFRFLVNRRPPGIKLFFKFLDPKTKVQTGVAHASRPPFILVRPHTTCNIHTF